MATTTITTQPPGTDGIVLGKSPFQNITSLETLAENQSGKVEIVQDEQSTKYIRKMRTLGQENGWDVEKLLKREFEFVTTSPHPAFAQMHGYAQTTMNDKIVCTQLKEFVEGQDLEKVIERGGALGPETAVEYMMEVTQAFSFIHEKNRLIRDFKPSQLIVQDQSPKNKKKNSRKVRLTDLDSLGSEKQIAGTSGSTMMVGSDIWTHPYGMASGLASKQTDLFTLGTTFYYALTGQKPEQVKNTTGVTTLSDENFTLLEQKLASYQGGPELARTIKKLVEPIPSKQYKTADELQSDLEQIQTIFNDGYEALANQRFRVHRENQFLKGLRDLKNNGGSIGSALIEKTADLFSSLGSLMFGSATRFTLSLGAIASIGSSWASYSYLQHQSETRAVMDFPEVAAERHPILQASAALADTAQEIGGLYVILTGTSGQKVPNDIKLLRQVAEEKQKVEHTKEVLTKAKTSLDPYANSISNIYSGGGRIRRSFIHTSQDNYHTEIYTVPVTSCSGSGKTQSCSTHMETRTRQVYDDTDHYWTFTPSIAVEGAKELEDGTDALRFKHPTAISYDDLLRDKVPAVDSLGRRISKSDLITYAQGQNEWLKKGMAPKYNALANIGIVVDNRSIQAIIEIAENGFATHPGYPLRTHVNNTCSSCDDQGAPAGYLHVKDVEYITSAYTRPFGDLQYVFRSAEPELDRLLTELSSVSRRLDNGDKLDADDLLKAADIGTTVYKVMVADSVIAAPTAGERTWWPIGLLFGGLVLTGIAAGVVAYNSNNSYSHRRFGGYGGY